MAIVVNIPDPERERIKALFYLILRDWMTAGEVRSMMEELQSPVKAICTDRDLERFAESLAKRLIHGDSD